MKIEKRKELYEAPRIELIPQTTVPSILVTFSLEGDIEDITEDSNEW